MSYHTPTTQQQLITLGRIGPASSPAERAELCARVVCHAYNRPVYDVTTVSYKLPAHWATYLLYGDASGLSEDEVEEIEDWLASLLEDCAGFKAVDCEPCGFGTPTIGGLPSDLAKFTFQII